jgi:hypothetical protein
MNACLTVVDNWSRQSPVLEVGFRISIGEKQYTASEIFIQQPIDKNESIKGGEVLFSTVSGNHFGRSDMMMGFSHLNNSRRNKVRIRSLLDLENLKCRLQKIE